MPSSAYPFTILMMTNINPSPSLVIFPLHCHFIMRANNNNLSIVGYIMIFKFFFISKLVVVQNVKNKVCFALELIFVFVHAEILFQNLFVSQLCVVFLQNVFQKVYD